MIGHDTLRLIDRLIGIPSCALLTMARRLRGRFTVAGCSATTPLRRVLFIQLAESGSMVLADPSIRELATRTGAGCYCVTFAINRTSLAITGTVPDEHIFAIRTTSVTALLIDSWRFLVWVRRMHIDAIVDFELFSRLTAVLCVATGVRRRTGFHRFGSVGLYRGDLYSYPVPFNPYLHVAQNYLLLVEALLGAYIQPAARVPSGAISPRIALRPIAAAEHIAVRTRLERILPRSGGARRLVLVNANASAMLPQRRWPQDAFVALIRSLLDRHANVCVLLIGSADDRPTTAAIARGVSDARCVDGAREPFAVGELPALFSLASLLVSNDSGPAHFASVTRLPVIVLFGPETPVLFRPLGNASVLTANLACSPCVHVGNQRRTRCSDNQCMKRITVAEVLAQADAVLAPTVYGSIRERTAQQEPAT